MHANPRMLPIKHGDFFLINVDEHFYQQSLDEFKGSLIGRIMMSMGDKPYSTLDLTQKLREPWTQDFNPNKVWSSMVQVWVHILDLPIEYWHPTIPEAMASAMGTLIKVDDRTSNKIMGHYARLMIEIDMKSELV
ncbi:hypothetical protein ACS0TY_021768 [Phlomoides rotata]